MVGGPLDAEVVHLGAERQHEIVVLERRHLVEPGLAAVEVDSRDAGLVDGDVRLVVEEVAKRVRDGLRVEQPGRELVEHGLERVVVVRVDERHADVGVLQLAARADPSEASPENEDTRAGCASVG